MTDVLALDDILDFAAADLQQLAGMLRKFEAPEDVARAAKIMEVLRDATADIVARYEGLGALITYSIPKSNVIERNFAFVPTTGKTTFADNLSDANMLVARAADEADVMIVKYSWWMAPNENAHGEAKTSWTRGGEAVFDFTSRINWLREKRT